MNYSKAILFCLAVSFGIVLLLLSAMFVDAWPSDSEPKQLKIGPWQFELPVWWDEVEASLPATLECDEDIAKHIRTTFGADVGGPENWREALKSWAIAESKLDSFPVYIAHCYDTGGQYREAATTYGELYELADTQGDNCEWYQCYLAYEAAGSLIKLGATDEAKVWLSRSAAFADADKAKDAIRYYAAESQAMLEKIEADKGSDNSSDVDP